MNTIINEEDVHNVKYIEKKGKNEARLENVIRADIFDI